MVATFLAPTILPSLILNTVSFFLLQNMFLKNPLQTGDMF
jgi:hypothetical protein